MKGDGKSKVRDSADDIVYADFDPSRARAVDEFLWFEDRHGKQTLIRTAEYAAKQIAAGQRDSSNRSKGGKAPKKLKLVQDLVDQLVAENAGATARDIWELIPESHDGDPPVYRDAKKVFQFDDATGRAKAIKFPTFRAYVTRARAKLRSN